MLLAAPLMPDTLTPDAWGFGRRRSTDHPCPQLSIVNADDLDLTDVEIRLLCGDPEGDRIGKAWKSIPPAQAERSFRNFLQDRGYHFPKFKPRADGGLELDPGELTKVRSVSGVGVPEEAGLDSYRGIRGEPFTPKKISLAKSWLKRRMQEIGYPCPEIEARGFPATGEVRLTWVNPAPKATIEGLSESRAQDIPAHILRRSDAFHLGDRYSLIETEITGKRTADRRTVSAHDLAPVCPIDERETPPDRIVIDESTVVGPPRKIALGLLVNTEVGPEARASWAHTRLGRAVSHAGVALRGSYREQSGRAFAQWFYANTSTRAHLAPLISFAHQNERPYELLAFRTRALWETDGDFTTGLWKVAFGPGWQNLQQIDGVGPLNSSFFSTHLELEYQTHRFEYFASSPRDGYQAGLSITAVPSHVSQVGHPVLASVHQHWITAIGRADPPWIVFAARGRAFSTFLPSHTRMQDVPIDFRNWMGGGQDLRGFGRKELPTSNLGARTGATIGTELRAVHVLPWDLEPIVLFDAAVLRTGLDVASESSQMFWNIGGGLRWESPVGTVRSTVAHGFDVDHPNSDLSHWQFFLSLGEEF